VPTRCRNSQITATKTAACLVELGIRIFFSFPVTAVVVFAVKRACHTALAGAAGVLEGFQPGNHAGRGGMLVDGQPQIPGHIVQVMAEHGVGPAPEGVLKDQVQLRQAAFSALSLKNCAASAAERMC
jgi:hypothetical protein